MADIAETQNENTGSSRRRSPRRRGPRRDKKEDGSDKPKKEKKERAPRPVSIPIPSEIVGTVTQGTVTAIVKRGKLKFGFIHLGEASVVKEDAPRVYFNFSELPDDTILRKGYHVQFTCKIDDKDRQYAAGISLTEEGVILAAEIDKEFQNRVANSQGEKGGAGRERKPRERKERRPMEEKNVTLKVKCEGFTEEKEIVFNVNQSLGRLKNVATSAFEAPVTHNVYYDGVFLTKSILIELGDNAVISLGPSREVAEEA